MGETKQALASAVNTNGPRIIVYNPLPWARSGTAGVFLEKAVEPTSWRDIATGKTVLAKTLGRVVQLDVTEMPALGYRTYVPTPDPDRRTGSPPAKYLQPVTSLDSPFFHAELDHLRGVITSLVEKRSGRELVDRASQYGLGQFLYERFDKDYHTRFVNDYCKKPLPRWADEFGRANLPPVSEAAYRAASPRALGWRTDTSIEPSAVAAYTLAEHDEMVPQRTQLRIALSRTRPCVELEWMTSRKKPDPWPEAGWLCLPFAIDQPQFRLGRLGSIIHPAKDCVRGANNEMFSVDTGLTITGRDGKGVGICPIDSPLVSLGRPGAFRYTREWTPRKPTVFVNLFNNVWGTNFQQWIGGTLSCSVRIWSVEGKGAEADLITPAWEYRNGCKAAFFDGPAGKLPPMQSGLELSRKGVLVTAFGPNPDGEGILLRLWEQAGQDGICRVRLPEALRTARPKLCDLRGRPLDQPIALRDGWLEVPLTHFAPASVILER